MDIPELVRLMVRAKMYVKGPMLLYHRSVPTSSSLIPLSDPTIVPPALAEYLLASEERLASAGFGAPVRGVSTRNSSRNTFVSLLEHPAEGALGVIFVSRATSSDRLAAAVWFHSAFNDGITVVTSNSQLGRRAPRRREFDVLRFIDIDDAAELFGIHRFRVSERGRSAVRVSMTRGKDPFEYVRREDEQTMEHWVRCGYYTRLDDGSLRMTRIGATLSAWRGMFPWREMSELKRARATAAVLTRYRESTQKGGSR